MDASTGSATARVVAVGRAVGVGGRRDEHVAALLPAADRALVTALRAVRVGQGRRVLGWSAHPGLRMLAVDAAVTAAAELQPSATIVIIGAGYDTRAWRLPALVGRRVVEIDHPATQADKQRRMSSVHEASATLTLLPADLALDDLEAVLTQAGHDMSIPTIWVWEAVIPYLPAAAVDVTLAVLARRSASGSTVIATTVRPALVAPAALGRMLGPTISVAMRGIGEPVLLAEEDGAVASRLAGHGFVMGASTGVRGWARDAGVRVVGPIVEERLLVAEMHA
jgi:methyltransferase (TIGR00027 family)